IVQSGRVHSEMKQENSVPAATSQPSTLSDGKTDQARERLDAHVREIIDWHFTRETGALFWLERACTLSFDRRKDVLGFADLHKFGLFEDEWLRGGPVRR